MTGNVNATRHTVAVGEVRAMTIRPAVLNSVVILACLAAAYAVVMLTLGLHNCW